MIRVILPKNYTNLLNDLNNDVLSDVVSLLFGTKLYEQEYEERRSGRYIKVINDETNETHFVCFSNPNNDSRNAHLMQFVSPSYVDYYNYKSENKHMHVYLINPDGNDRTDYIKMFYRCFLTIGINILNLHVLNLSDIAPFTTYTDLKTYRDKTSGRNLHNRQTFFTDDTEQITLYGKTFGANAMESFIFGLTLSKLADKPLVFYPVLDNESDSISTDQKNILTSSGVTFGDAIELRKDGYAKPTSRTTSRNTPSFHYNLLHKFGEKRCYLCGCDMEHLVIGSHIERITDIDHNESYSEEVRAEKAIDGDNGLWLCANHDKMFEYGIIYFVDDALTVSVFIRDTNSLDFINQSIFDILPIYPSDIESTGVISGSEFKIRPTHYNPKMNEYINKHLARIA